MRFFNIKIERKLLHTIICVWVYVCVCGECKLKILYFDVYCISGNNFIHKEAVCDTHVCKLRLSQWNWLENQTKSKRKFYGGDTFLIIYGQCSIKGYFETLWVISFWSKCCVERFSSGRFTLLFSLLSCCLTLLYNS